MLFNFFHSSNFRKKKEKKKRKSGSQKKKINARPKQWASTRLQTMLTRLHGDTSAMYIACKWSGTRNSIFSYFYTLWDYSKLTKWTKPAYERGNYNYSPEIVSGVQQD